MEQKLSYSLGKTERLKSQKLIDALFTNGKSFSLFPFRVLWMYADKTEMHIQPAAGLQCGFSVSKKYFKRATQRNRIKRLMREAYRLQKNGLALQLQKHNYQMIVFLLYVGNEVPDYKVVTDKMKSVLLKLEKLTIAAT